MNTRRYVQVLIATATLTALTGCVGPTIDPQGEPRVAGDVWTETTSGSAPAAGSCIVAEDGDALLPDAKCTPGAITSDISAADTSPVCLSSNAEEPAVDEGAARSVFAAYGIDETDAANYTIDYLIPRSLGGANDFANLWPLPSGDPVVARKDQMDIAVADAVCNGRAGIQAAQFVMGNDWPGALTSLGLAK